jgi:hypothetical protein
MFRDESKALDNEETLKNIEMKTNNIQTYSNSLKDDMDYIKGRSKDYGWKVWKWPEITIDIINTISHITNNVNNALNTANNVKSKIDNLKPVLDVNTDSYINNVNNPSCEKDACSMADELTGCMNNTFTVKNVNVRELRKGDIVQYLSQKSYPRYLTVHEIKIKNNNNTRNLLGHTPTDIPFITLKGPGDKLVEIPIIGECIQLVPTNKIDTGVTLQNTVQIQQKNINKDRKQAQKTAKTAKRLHTTYKIFEDISYILLGTTVFTGLAGFLSGPAFITVEIVALGLSVAAAVSIVVTWELYHNYNKINKKANDLATSANNNEADLTTYTKIEEKHETIMNITTFEGIPVIKQPPIIDWRNFQAIIIETPQHGELLMGPGLQFLYGPNEGYVGEDSFRYNIMKNGQIVGNVQVKVQIKPIPILDVPKEENS